MGYVCQETSVPQRAPTVAYDAINCVEDVGHESIGPALQKQEDTWL